MYMGGVMPINDSMKRAKRLLALERLIVSQPGRKWRTKEVADILGVSEDTALLDLKELSSKGGLPLITPKVTAGFTWELPADYRPLEPLHLDYADGAALYAAARLLWQQQDERNDSVRDALLQLISILPEALRPHLVSMVSEHSPQASRQDMTSIFNVLRAPNKTGARLEAGGNHLSAMSCGQWLSRSCPTSAPSPRAVDRESAIVRC